MKKLLFYCQHVLGIGHLIRSLEIARALTGFEVTLLNGGGRFEGLEFPENLRVIDLPSISSNAEFSELKAEDSRDVTEALFAKRREIILRGAFELKPDVILVELFPFGRLKFADEILALLEKGTELGARAVCSVRDILVTKSQQDVFEKQACEICNRYLTAVLVHSDPHFHSFEETFPSAPEVKVPVLHTGFISSGRPRTGGPREKLIVVSIGGGRVGGELLTSAAEAFKSLDAGLSMVLVTGPYFGEQEFAQLHRLKSDRLAVERFIPDFEGLLAKAALSISLAGYNTCMNLLNTGTPALLLPFAGHGNQEQTIRASKLRKAGIAGTLEAADLEPARFAARIEEALDMPRKPNPFDLAGAAKTNELLLKIASGGFDA